MRVLIIEDDAIVAENLCSIVQDEKHDVVGVARDKDAAIACLGSTEIDIALLDLRLSDGLTGFDVAAAAMAVDVPFVLVSANLRVLFSGTAGALGVIAKPYDDTTIIKTLRFIESALDGETVGAPPRGLVLSLEWIERLGLKSFSTLPVADPRTEIAAYAEPA